MTDTHDATSMTEQVRERLARYTAPGLPDPQTTFRGYYDASKQRTLPEKLGDAVRRFETRRGQHATVALVNPGQYDAIVAGSTLPALAELTIVPAPFVAPDTFYIAAGEHADD